MSRKHGRGDANDDDAPRGDGESVTTTEEPTQQATYAEMAKNFILTRGAFLVALDAESIAALLTLLGLDPGGTPVLAAQAPEEAKD